MLYHNIRQTQMDRQNHIDIKIYVIQMPVICRKHTQNPTIPLKYNRIQFMSITVAPTNVTENMNSYSGWYWNQKCFKGETHLANVCSQTWNVCNKKCINAQYLLLHVSVWLTPKQAYFSPQIEIGNFKHVTLAEMEHQTFSSNQKKQLNSN